MDQSDSVNATLVPKISTFSELPDVENSLYVFDIDETMIVFEEVSDEWWSRNFEKIYNETKDCEYASNRMGKLFVEVIKKNKHLPTDIDGFRKIENSLGETNNTIVFLTARPQTLETITYRQIETLGLRNTYPIYFSSEKGFKMRWLKEKMQTTYENIIFVDDKIYNIEDVKKECPEVKCFQFVPDEYIAKFKKSER